MYTLPIYAFDFDSFDHDKDIDLYVSFQDILDINL